ncbi:cobyrinate a,c-diamide synthase [Paludibacterium purpuratum]|uniref:Hydrogenobyrinic acid a,c-diamide synthase (Glutamine-hydrolysing) /cobyrinate a,c-diamide synthase n=1 Tax=Paludibacterium purpuratum TaxID=1144873 RepID=A0A4R7B7J9_9NEIS|nr:cobyrinate a,c-diamide synthase [Paludibacterium purpuratum]TDR79812.1 hydrogenobyrinic acid a,c-diamide synthase (glutamine-hydrolysing) /cobyrinate a,c-diamide synthase [Paludibacterium purpuratum]
METSLTRHCPALLMTAPASHQGKTTLTAGLARFHRDQGRRVRVFKIGPDFLDPYILERASGAPVESLDLWMTGEADCRARLYRAAAEADLILIEGSMGLFDGTPSSADLAEHFGLPLVAVIDAAGMAQTFGAVALGLVALRPQLRFHGVLANHVAGSRHADMLQQGLPDFIPYSGYIARQDDIGLPERHLGLVQAQEIDDLEARLDRAARQMADTALATLPPAVAFAPAELPAVPALLAGQRIAIARDAAFSFLYPANLQCLRDLGAELTFFSPLADQALPPCDAVYLPGGYPELHLARLADNRVSAESLRVHARAGKPLYAECGGMLYLFERLVDQHGRSAPLLGLLPGHAEMGKRLAALGLQQIELDGQILRGHTFHYSTLHTPLEVEIRATRAVGGAAGEAFYRQDNLQASYLHAWFPSNPLAVSRLFLGTRT